MPNLTPSDISARRTYFVQRINGEISLHGPLAESEAKKLAATFQALGDKAEVLNTSWHVQASVLRTRESQ